MPTADSDNAEQSSDDEMLLDKTLKASQYKRMENEHSASNSGSSNSGTLTRQGQLPTDLSGDDMRPQSCDSNFSGTVTPPASSTENLADPFGAAPFKTAKEKGSTSGSSATTPANGGIKVDSCPVPLLPNNPFLNDIMQSKTNSAPDTNKSLEGLSELSITPTTSERNREPSFSDFASERKSSEPGPPPSSHSLHDFSSIGKPSGSGDGVASSHQAGNATGAQGTVTLPRMQKSKTLDGIQHMSGDSISAHRHSQNIEPLLRRSQTDYDVGMDVQVSNYPGSKDDNDLSDSETLLDKTTGSLRKKDKGRKSPRLSKSGKSPRHSDTKRSLYADSGDYDGALTNEAFSEQDTPPAVSVGTFSVQDNSKQPKQPPAPSPKPKSIQPHPPTAPKPNTAERRPPVATKPKTAKTPPETAKKPSIDISSLKTPSKDKQNTDLKAQSKSETKAPQSAVAGKDSYKTHKRYSSYDLATGRAELSLCNETESSKSALVGKEGKSKKKGKIGLGIF